MNLPLWWDAYPRPVIRPPDEQLPSRTDVAIVGGGFTGLWTAYYLLRERTDLHVTILEAEHVGFGASGRNGGWVSALYPVSAETLARQHGSAAALAMAAELRHTVVEVGDVVAAEQLSGVGYERGGTLVLARNAAQVARARAAVAEGERWSDGTSWLDRGAARERLAAEDILGATFNPHCARIQPRALVEGLAAAVRRRGGVIVEDARVLDASPGVVTLATGERLRAGQIVRATEAFTATLPRLRRRVAPVYSLMVATEPLPASLWTHLGLNRREVFSDHGHVIIYGQRTADDRIAFGGRGAPYHFGSRVAPGFDRDEQVFAALRQTLRTLLPQLSSVRFTHAWGGPLGIARDWHPSVGYDANAGVGWAGGYVGDGVAATNLAGRTLTDLLLGRHTPLTALPWVNHRCPSWEPEPLRWLGINAGLRLATLADREEATTGRPARLGRLLTALTGH